MKRKRPVIPTLRRLGSRAARLLAFLPAMFVLAVPSVLYADPIQVGTAATPVRQVGSIDCNGNPGTGSFGLMKVSRTGDSLEVDVELTGARANTSFSIELWESDPDCYPDNNGNTGVVISTDSSGNGTATVNLSLPHPSLGGSTLGDGAGTDQLVMALDDTFSSGGGDSYAAGPISIDFTDTNRPPEVSAGYDTSGNSSSGAYVEGSVFDDGKKEPVVNTWSKVSGPGVATFDDPHSTSTHVSFDKLGTYTLKLSAYDGEFTGTDTVIVEVKDRYEVELKSWIPQSTTADPFVLAPTNFPNAAIPLMGSPLRECFESEWDGTANGSVRVLSSRFTGDNHDDYGQFASQRSPRDARIASYLEFEWDGSQMRVTDSSKWSGTTRRYVTIQTRDGGSKECQQAARADTATVPDVQMIAPNKFKLVVKGYDPLTPRDANQLSSVIGDACTVTPLLCPPLASLLLRVIPVTPSLDGEVIGTIQSDGKISFNYTADLFPSYGVGYRKNNESPKISTFVNASCIQATGYRGAANLFVGLQTAVFYIPGIQNPRPTGTLNGEPYSATCRQYTIGVAATEQFLRATVNSTTEPMLLLAASRMPQ